MVGGFTRHLLALPTPYDFHVLSVATAFYFIRLSLFFFPWRLGVYFPFGLGPVHSIFLCGIVRFESRLLIPVIAIPLSRLCFRLFSLLRRIRPLKYYRSPPVFIRLRSNRLGKVPDFPQSRNRLFLPTKSTAKYPNVFIYSNIHLKKRFQTS